MSVVALADKAGQGIAPRAGASFVETAAVSELTARATAYLDAGYNVHLAGPAGTGKTTLALHIAARRERTVTLIHGNDEASAADWVGRTDGYQRRQLVDNYIHSVMRSEEELRNIWVDSRLTTACLNGETLIYDEFNRSRPETNNLFLSILGERILNLPQRSISGDGGYIEVHPDFRAIFTSNPEEYAGTHKTQDALMDRLITIEVDHYDRATECSIIQAKSGLKSLPAGRITDLLRGLRELGASRHRPTIRAGIAIARVLAGSGKAVDPSNPFFVRVCYDILSVDMAKVRQAGTVQETRHRLIDEVMERVFATGAQATAAPDDEARSQ